MLGLAQWLLSLPALAQGQQMATLRLTQAEFTYGEGPAAPERGWTAVVLPDHFQTHPPAGDRTGWYRFAVDLAAPPEEPLVLLVQRVVLTAEFRLNGSLLNPDVRFRQPGGPAGTQMLNWPQWIVLPAGLFHVGRNELLIKLRSDRVTPAWISGISIGRPDALRGEYLLRDIAQRLVPQALFVLLLASLVFGLRLWWRERLPLQRQVVTATLLWLAHLGVYLVPALPLPWGAALALIAVLWIAFHWALLHLLWRLSDGGWAWFPRALSIGSAVPLVGGAAHGERTAVVRGAGAAADAVAGGAALVEAAGRSGPATADGRSRRAPTHDAGHARRHRLAAGRRAAPGAARRGDVPRTEVAQAIQDALHDLRLIIDAQDGAAQELHSMLHQWRERHQARVESLARA